MTLASVGVGAFFLAGAIAIGFLILLEWQARTAPIRGLLFIGFSGSTLLSLLGLTVYLYVATRFGVSLPSIVAPGRGKVILVALALLLGLYFFSLRGLSPKVAAAACGYAMLVLLGIAPDPAQSQDPWAASLLVVAIAFRLLTLR